MPSPKVVVSVSTYNTPKYLQGFLDTFEEMTSYSNVVCHIHSDDPRFKVAEVVNVPERWQIFEDDVNRFWGARRNHMVRDAYMENPDYIALFDDDMRFIHPDWLSYCMSIMANYHEIGILGLHWARLANGETQQDHHAPIETMQKSGCRPIHVKHFAPGNSWICRPEIFYKVGYFLGATTRDEWKAQHPGPDTEFHNRVLDNTEFILAATVDDLVWHAGLEEMK